MSVNLERYSPAQPAAVEAAVAATNSRLDEPAHKVGDSPEPARFELYQAGISICSQKVRTVLIEKDITFLCHELNPAPPDRILRHHFPEYIRMRLLGALPHHQLVSGFTGATSVATDGLEPTVVPTLVDHETGRVVLDSKYICNYIDECAQDSHRLIPAGREAETEALVDLVDRTPHPSLLMGAESDLDRRPAFLKGLPIPGADVKIQIMQGYLESNEDDPILSKAYQAKIARELAVQDFYSRQGRMQETVEQVREILSATETALGEHDGDWLLGAEFTMADIHTVLNLFRLQNVGFGDEFGDRTRRYANLGYQRPSIVKGMIGWPAMTWFWAPEYFDEEILALYVGPKPK